MSSVKEAHCPECAAPIEDGSHVCWLCSARLDAGELSSEGVSAGDRGVSTAQGAPTAQKLSFSLEGLMLVVTLVSVCLGAFTLFPGLGILLAILIAPVFVRTVMVVRRREERGRPVDPLARIGLFLGSFATAMVIIVVVSVASLGTFCAVCLSIGKEEAIPFAAAVAILVTIGAIVLLVRWIRARWRHDTNPK